MEDLGSLYRLDPKVIEGSTTVDFVVGHAHVDAPSAVNSQSLLEGTG